MKGNGVGRDHAPLFGERTELVPAEPSELATRPDLLEHDVALLLDELSQLRAELERRYRAVLDAPRRLLDTAIRARRLAGEVLRRRPVLFLLGAAALGYGLCALRPPRSRVRLFS